MPISTPSTPTLKQNLPPDGAGIGEPLVTVKDPPPVQVLVPGFTVRATAARPHQHQQREVPARRHARRAGYNGDIWLLKDTDGDGLEDKAELFYENKGQPPRADRHGPRRRRATSTAHGVFVASKGKVSLIVDTDGDGKADKEIVVAEGWKEIVQSVDAIGVALDPKDGSVYFGRGTANYANGYLIDKDGKAHYDVKDEYGTIQQVSPDFKTREIVATGIRFPVGMHFNTAGDLFCTDQEGATWLPNGNPFDELLHIDLKTKPALRLPAAAPEAPAERDRRAEHVRLRPAAPIDVRVLLQRAGEGRRADLRPEGVGRRRDRDRRVARQALPHAAGEDRRRLRREEPDSSPACRCSPIDCCVAPDGVAGGRVPQRRAGLGHRADGQGEALQDQLHRPRAPAAGARVPGRAARGARRVRPAG